MAWHSCSNKPQYAKIRNTTPNFIGIFGMQIREFRNATDWHRPSLSLPHHSITNSCARHVSGKKLWVKFLESPQKQPKEWTTPCWPQKWRLLSRRNITLKIHSTTEPKKLSRCIWIDMVLITNGLTPQKRGLTTNDWTKTTKTSKRSSGWRKNPRHPHRRADELRGVTLQKTFYTFCITPFV